MSRNRSESRIKYLLVAFMTLCFFIPYALLRVQISDREHYMDETFEEVSSSWAEPQTLAGPVISYTQITEVKKVVDKKTVIETKESAQVLYPSTLEVTSDLEIKKLHRAIYDVNVYSTVVHVTGSFNLDDQILSPSAKNQKIVLRLSDLRGIYDNAEITLGDKKYQLNPEDRSSSEDSWEERERQSVIVSPQIALNLDCKELKFSLDLSLNGSRSFKIRPVGDVTTLKISSKYSDPSFIGDFLPINREVSENGFNAEWKVLKMNRSNPYAVGIGVDLLPAVTQYQMAERCSKYSMFVIILIFIACIIVEVVTKRNMSVLQYGVIGLSLMLFYLLLLAFVDFLSFGQAYLLAAVMTVVSLSLYFKAVLKHKSGWILGGVTALCYLVCYAMLHMKNYALLTGALLLFALVCVIMYFTRNSSPTRTLENE